MRSISTPLGPLHPARAALAALVTALVVALFALANDAITVVHAASLAVFVVWLVASAFDDVREHPAYDLASSAVVTVLFALWTVANEWPALVPLALTVLMAIGTAVEAYNYRYGTAHLRIDW